MTASDRSVDVVVVTYRSESTIVDCLSSVQDIDDLADIIVVDHGSDASHLLAVPLATTVVRDYSNPGFGAGQNRGVAMGHAPYVLLVNPDAVVEPSHIRHGVDVLRREPGIGAVQGAVVGTDGQLERSQGDLLGPLHLVGRSLGLRQLFRWAAFREVAGWFAVSRDSVDRAVVGDVNVAYLSATVLLVRRSAFEAVGGFDERFFLYGEDLDLCQRFRRAGWGLIAVPECWAIHCNGASSSSTWEREVAWWRGTLTYAGRWWPLPSLALGLVAAAVMCMRLATARPRLGRHALTEVVFRGFLGGRRLRRSRACVPTPPAPTPRSRLRL